MKTIKPDVKDVLESLVDELQASEKCPVTKRTRLRGAVWYFPKPDNRTALNAYEAITGKTTTHFIWLKLDKEILSSWINALEVICG